MFLDEFGLDVLADEGVELFRVILAELDLPARWAKSIGDGEEELRLAVGWKLRRSRMEMLLEGRKAARSLKASLVRELNKLARAVGETPEEAAQKEEGVRRPPLWSLHDHTILPLLDAGKEGLKAGYHNLLTILGRDREWAGRFKLNLFSQRVELDGLPLTDSDTTAMAAWVNGVYGPAYTPAQVLDVAVVIAKESSYHPVTEYLHSLEWDGVPRIDDWLHQYASVADNVLHSSYARKWLIGCVARVMSPGCKMDTVLILHGEQGAYKSTLFRIMAGEWFSDSPIAVGDKDGAQNLQGIWIWEVGELDSFSRSESSAVKRYMSSQQDRFRPSYGRLPVDVPRQTVFCGTTNLDNFVRDETGSRRFWICSSGTIDLDGLRDVRDQLWAEAFEAYQNGESWWLGRDEERARGSEAASFTDHDTWYDLLSGLETQYQDGIELRWLMEHEFGIAIERQDKSSQARVCSALRAAGWKKERVRQTGGKRPVLWVPPKKR